MTDEHSQEQPFGSATLAFPGTPENQARNQLPINIGQILECALYYDHITLDAQYLKLMRVPRGDKRFDKKFQEILFHGYKGSERTEFSDYVGQLVKAGTVAVDKNQIAFPAHVALQSSGPYAHRGKREER